MLPSVNRLPASEIRTVTRSGKRFFSGPLQLIIIPSTSPVSRFAFIVSTGVDKRATVRNRMKRLLREAVQHFLPSLKSAVDVVIMTKKGLPDTQKQVETLVKEIFQKAGLL